MIIQYFGYLISLILAVSAVMFLIRSIHLAFKHSHQLIPTQKSVEISAQNALLSLFSFLLSVFTFVTSSSGFSWETLFILLSCGLMLSAIIIIGFIIKSDTAGYLSKKNAPSIFDENNPLRKYAKDSFVKEDPHLPDTDKELKI